MTSSWDVAHEIDKMSAINQTQISNSDCLKLAQQDFSTTTKIKNDPSFNLMAIYFNFHGQKGMKSQIKVLSPKCIEASKIPQPWCKYIRWCGLQALSSHHYVCLWQLVI